MEIMEKVIEAHASRSTWLSLALCQNRTFVRNLTMGHLVYVVGAVILHLGKNQRCLLDNDQRHLLLLLHHLLVEMLAAVELHPHWIFL
jgi:hypothetical protein